MYLHENREKFQEAVSLTAYRTNMVEKIIEKDYYVVMILRLLSEKLPFVVFKGGTSLSKCHKTIKRFSEDIDITIDTSISQGQKKKLKCALIAIAQELGLHILNLEEIRSRRDYNRYEIAYDTVSVPLEDGIVPVVIVETSFTAISFPTEILPLESYIGETMTVEAPELLERNYLKAFTMKVQTIDRTLADKVFAVCDYYLQDKVRRHSRHIYDIYKILPLVPQNEKFRELVQEVREIRKQSHICPSAQEEIDVPELLQEIIETKAYKADYQTVTEALLEEPIAYEEAVSGLMEILKNGMFEG